MISFDATITLGGQKRKLSGKDDWGAAFAALSGEFELQAQVVHRKSVFQILRTLIFFTPVDTGRLRGSWTPIFDKYGAASIYQPMMTVAAPGQKTTKPELTSKGIAEGKRQGFYVDRPFVTIIGTNVQYAAYVEQKLAFIAKARAIGDGVYHRNFEAFFKSIADKGLVPEQKDTEA